MGIKGQEAETMTGVFVPAGTPKEIVDLLQQEIAAIVKTPDVKAKLLELGIVPEGDTPEQFAAYVKADIAKWKDQRSEDSTSIRARRRRINDC